jgi:hypothetical protein
MPEYLLPWHNYAPERSTSYPFPLGASNRGSVCGSIKSSLSLGEITEEPSQNGHHDDWSPSLMTAIAREIARASSSQPERYSRLKSNPD